MLDYKKIGNFIALERDKIKLTQEELANKLFVTRQAVSKWERGLAIPDVGTLLNLCRIFNVTSNELLAGERIDENNKQKIDNVPIDVLKYGKKKLKRMILFFSILVILLLIIFFIYYFVSSYNKLQVFKISGNSENFQLVDTIGVFSNETAYIKFSEIYSDKYIPKYVEFYYNKEQNKKVIFASDSGDALIVQGNDSNEYFNFDDVDYIFKNMYIDVYYDDGNIGKVETIKLNSEKIYSNINLLFLNNNKVSNGVFTNSKNENNTKLTSIFKKNENGDYVYTYNINKMKNTIKYNIESGVVLITRKNKEFTEEVLFLGNLFKDFNYTKYDNKSKVVVEFTYMDGKCQCSIGDCSNYEMIYSDLNDTIINKYFK